MILIINNKVTKRFARREIMLHLSYRNFKCGWNGDGYDGQRKIHKKNEIHTQRGHVQHDQSPATTVLPTFQYQDGRPDRWCCFSIQRI